MSMESGAARHLRLIVDESTDTVKPKSKFFLEVAANPRVALTRLKETNPELAQEIQAKLDNAMENNRKANVGRSIIELSDI
jgi:hypothetical protein